MARSIQEIYDQIIDEKETKSSLSELLPDNETYEGLVDDLTSGSKVAIWRLWAYIIAVAHFAHETLFDMFVEEVEALAAVAPAGTPRWYIKKIFEFQYGDLLEYINNQYVYAVVDLDKRIVKRAAIEERPDGVVLVKVAKSGPEKLDNDEKDALFSYLQKIKFAGTRLAVVSIDPDSVRLVYDIYYDPQIPLALIQEATDAAMEAFVSDLPFNAAFNITAFTDALQLVEGIVDPVYQSSTNEPDGGVETPFTVEVIPAAGWFVYSDTADNMFNWIAVT